MTKEFCKFFLPQELVDPQIYRLLGDQVIKLIDPRLLIAIDKLREAYGPILINNWHTGGSFKESGLRTQITATGAPRSAHKLGQALDLKFLTTGLTPQEVWADMKKNMDSKDWDSYIKRIEDPAITKTWLHIDTIEHSSLGIKVFKP